MPRGRYAGTPSTPRQYYFPELDGPLAYSSSADWSSCFEQNWNGDHYVVLQHTYYIPTLLLSRPVRTNLPWLPAPNTPVEVMMSGPPNWCNRSACYYWQQMGDAVTDVTGHALIPFKLDEYAYLSVADEVREMAHSSRWLLETRLGVWSSSWNPAWNVYINYDLYGAQLGENGCPFPIYSVLPWCAQSGDSGPASPPCDESWWF